MIARTTLEDIASRTASPVEPVDFARLHDAHVQDVARWVRRLGGPGFDFEDAVQEVFMVAFRRLPSLDPRANRRTWLFGIARNIVLHHQRSHSIWRRLRAAFARELSPGALTGDEQGPSEHLERKQREQRLYRVLSSLPDKYRVPFILFEIEELPVAEISRLLGVKPATCWTLIRRGRQKVVRSLELLKLAEAQELLRGGS
ncbi:MAG TPA: sigma-70 family RNA polymerase sigma factor [Anaeromyxobacteraceae bacterium]|nr:sigma-70 family RNA polymerase sigma factor [Anaeromyxobacteraceae bacterium]